MGESDADEAARCPPSKLCAARPARGGSERWEMARRQVQLLTAEKRTAVPEAVTMSMPLSVPSVS